MLHFVSRAFFAAPTDRSFSGSNTPDDADPPDGLVVGVGRRRARFVRYPDGEFRAVDLDFDRSVFDDPDSVPRAEQSTVQASILDGLVEERTEACDADDTQRDSEEVRTVAEAMLTVRPNSLVAVAQDAKGRVLCATITPLRQNLTRSTFRASIQTLPVRASRVTFAARQPVPGRVRKAVSEIADIALVRVSGFLVID